MCQRPCVLWSDAPCCKKTGHRSAEPVLVSVATSAAATAGFIYQFLFVGVAGRADCPVDVRGGADDAHGDALTLLTALAMCILLTESIRMLRVSKTRGRSRGFELVSPFLLGIRPGQCNRSIKSWPVAGSCRSIGLS